MGGCEDKTASFHGSEQPFVALLSGQYQAQGLMPVNCMVCLSVPNLRISISQLLPRTASPGASGACSFLAAPCPLLAIIARPVVIAVEMMPLGVREEGCLPAP